MNDDPEKRRGTASTTHAEENPAILECLIREDRII
jgi:hypothetical protein